MCILPHFKNKLKLLLKRLHFYTGVGIFALETSVVPEARPLWVSDKEGISESPVGVQSPACEKQLLGQK